MPRLQVGQVPKYRHHRARGLAVVRINGVDHYLGPYKSKASYQEYHRLVSEWVHFGCTLRHVEETRLSVVELVVQYLAHAKTYYVKDGKVTSEYPSLLSALNPLKYLYGREPADEFGPLKLQVVREKLTERNNRKTTNKHVSRIKRMFRWAVAQQLVPGSVYQDLAALEGLKRGRSDAREPEPVGPVSEEVVEATIPHLPEPVAGLVRFQLFTGCRPGEAMSMRPRDVKRSKEPWVYVPASHKTEHHGKTRKIFIGPQAMEVVRPRLERPDSEYCFCPREVRKDAGPRYTNDSYRRAITRICERHGIKPWHPNQLRHRMATRTREKYGLEAVAASLGHSRLSTSEIYAEKNIALAAQVATECG